ncbi:4'-phosphopantetheinyl transferase family protein [Luteibaculum oceani]|uniref:4'-phosphopantetheinyl transferase superfamily protein n=1 Tax=Luteibaculum oceani TaxID=1294296 RepID=A0A5C6V1I8_9FLAO|nr:4'-phosphopantetheinyl transferase superfamily protein [Luteibaculum oceani]TXC78844.1 4'-phosphopantetheinyl transferase superfamily protein [Luteibaculum oceani]
MFTGIKNINHFIEDGGRHQVRLYDISRFSPDGSFLSTWLAAREREELKKVKSDLKTKQKASVLGLIAQEFGSSGIIQKQESGKPELPDQPYEITISHCKELVGYAFGENPLGMDIHHYDKKVTRISHKFLNEFEFEFCEKYREQPWMDLFWAVKEAVFKIYGSNLPFKDIKIDVAGIDTKSLSCEVKGKDNIDVSYALHKNFCICLAELKA